MSDTYTCPKCGGVHHGPQHNYTEKWCHHCVAFISGRPWRDVPKDTPRSSPDVYVEWERESEWSTTVETAPDTETRLYDLSRKQNRTEAENEELARLRREYRERTGYDYV